MVGSPENWFSQNEAHLRFLVLMGCRIHNFFECRVALNSVLHVGGMRDVALMNRLNKTESVVFIFWMMYFQRIPISDNGE